MFNSSIWPIITLCLLAFSASILITAFCLNKLKRLKESLHQCCTSSVYLLESTTLLKLLHNVLGDTGGALASVKKYPDDVGRLSRCIMGTEGSSIFGA